MQYTTIPTVIIAAKHQFEFQETSLALRSRSPKCRSAQMPGGRRHLSAAGEWGREEGRSMLLLLMDAVGKMPDQALRNVPTGFKDVW